MNTALQPYRGPTALLQPTNLEDFDSEYSAERDASCSIDDGNGECQEWPKDLGDP